MSGRPAGGQARSLRRVVGAFRVPEGATGGYEAMQDLGLRVLLATVAGILTLAWLAPGLSNDERRMVTGLAVLQVGYGLLSSLAGKSHEALRVASVFTDVAAPFTFAFFVPDMLVPVLFVTFLYIAFHSFAAGRLSGLILSGWALALAATADALAPAQAGLSPFEILSFGLVLCGVSFTLDAMGAERRRHTRQLARLHRALSSVTGAPDLKATLDSVSAAARDAVGATFVAVLQPEGGELAVLGETGGLVADTREARRQALAAPSASPSGVALTTGEPVLVSDFATDERFSHWAVVVEQFGWRSMVAVPFGEASHRNGTLNAYFDRPGAVSTDDVDLLTAFTRQAALLVARAVAFEREREADQLKSQFVATVSHELRTPLTAVHGFITTVLDRWDQLDDGDRRELLTRARRNASELRDLVEQVLDFTTIEAGELDVAQERVHVCEAVRQLAGDLEPALGGHPVQVSGDDDLVIAADARAFDRIVSNLLTNAAKHSPAGAPITVACTRSASPAAALAFIDVIDRGPGVPEGEEERIFERFYRIGEPGLVRGTGIGLAVARQFAELINAALTVQRRPEGGGCFRLAVPLATERGAAAQHGSTARA